MREGCQLARIYKSSLLSAKILDRLGRVRRLSRGLAGDFKDIAPIWIDIHFWEII